MSKEMINKVLDFYNSVSEKGRLERGLGVIEFYRTKQILSKYINKDSNVIYDIGGGVGIYSDWLARKNNNVYLLDLSPNAVEYAKSNYNTFVSEVCDARNIDKDNESADIILLMGPLYHLQNIDDRLKVLNECYRVLKKGGLLFSVGISKFSTMTWALSTFGTKNELLTEKPFVDMVERELKEGIHDRPKEYPNLITQAYFHTPLQLQSEIETVGFKTLNKHAIEGTIWFTPDLNEKWEDMKTRDVLLNILEITEHEIEIMGMSPHFMIVSQK
ncbi:MAG: class I SAM-dependent methyltransferase [Paraclostridium sp.]|uniref:class I SAM-dependent methyltransferase n=1 Tax=Paraclostridium sp. TaxID=2023273 RepID=UPI003F352D3C